MSIISCTKIYGLIFILLMFVSVLNAQNRNNELQSDRQNSYYSYGMKYYIQHKYLLAEKNLSLWFNDNSATRNIKGLNALADSYWVNRRYRNAYEIYQRLKRVITIPKLAAFHQIIKRLSDIDAMLRKYTLAAEELNNIDAFKYKRNGFLLSGLYLSDSVNWIVGYLNSDSKFAERLPYVFNGKLIVTVENSVGGKVNLRTDAMFSKLEYLPAGNSVNHIKGINFNQKRGSLDNFMYVPSESVKQLAVLHEVNDAPLINKSFFSSRTKSFAQKLPNSVEIDSKFSFNIGNISIQKTDSSNPAPVAYFMGNNNDKKSIKDFEKNDSAVIPISVYIGDIYDIYKGDLKETKDGVSIKNTRKMAINGFTGTLLNASVSSDGKIIVFSGKDSATADNYDLFYASRTTADTWGNVIKFGANINTEGDEVFPQIQNDGTLFFSSDGLPGLGALDIYYIPCFYTNGKIIGELFSLIPQHFGYPVNSAFDDYGVFVTKQPVDKEYKILDSLEGYFTTNRSGNDRVYTFKHKNSAVTYSGIVNTKTLKGNDVGIPDVLVGVYKITASDTTFFTKAITDSLGNYSFRAYPDINYIIRAEKENYVSSVFNFKPIASTPQKINDIFLERAPVKYNPPEDSINNNQISKPPTLNNDDIAGFIKKNEKLLKSWTIHHEFDRVNLIESDEKFFDSIVNYVKSHNAIVVKVYSTADCFGTLEHNNKLARDRSIFIKNNLESQGISKIVEIVGIGNGERIIGCPTVRDDINIARQVANRYTKIFVIETDSTYNPSLPNAPSSYVTENKTKLIKNVVPNKAAGNEIPGDVKNYVTDNEQYVGCWVVHHEFDKIDVIGKDEKVLDSIASYIKLHPASVLKIYSTADCYGSYEHNDRLAKQRSVFVRGYLTALGVNRFIEVVGVGKGERIVGCPFVRDSVNIARQVANRYTKIFVVVGETNSAMPLLPVIKLAKEKDTTVKAAANSVPNDIKRYVKKDEKFVKSWTIHHEYDKKDIVEADKKVFENIAAYYKLHPKAIFRIYSTADCYGSEEHNRKLAKDRSIFARNYLVSYGIDKIVEVVGMENGERVVGCPNVKDAKQIVRQSANRYTKIFVVSNK